ncbi:rhodanese-like domain-containing protein [Atopomonas sediminilitoris]|uniref:rhodanese-like domain-containing protein n=1 Tax=Atopomonas sediminilitoris TaxID=2919919 RepID=UPI001F4DDD5F|nr:rhodanese-like domain-containing protein [Atopomonas sediminilitoris]MCJ8170873.1 rhodanese-like domain-containing protein [Atopomonas sediminilitoris]
MSTQVIAAQQFAAARRSGNVRFLVDVRSPAEYRQQHVQGARNVPLDQINPQTLANSLKAEGLSSGDELYLICQTGMRARKAAEQLQSLLPGVQVVEGGTEACIACGLPANQQASQVISLQRQVQITAGSMILTGVILGSTVHPYWYGLAGFVGAGLTFAGLSGTCAMALLLARMPWNR